MNKNNNQNKNRFKNLISILERLYPIILIICLISIFLIINNHPTKQPLTAKVTMQTTANITGTSWVICSKQLKTGWNLVSLYCLPYTDFDDGFASILDTYDAIFAYDSSSKEWVAYNPDLPSWVVQSKPYADKKQAYWIKQKQDDTWYYNGTNPNNVIISLYSGWNLIGYPNNEEELINTTLSGIGYSIIWTYDNANNKMLYYKNSTNNTFTMMQPGQGYWINSSYYQYLGIT